MSESEAHLGNFVISVVVQKDEAPVHFIIQVNNIYSYLSVFQHSDFLKLIN